jgi:hypothetical protein
MVCHATALPHAIMGRLSLTAKLPVVASRTCEHLAGFVFSVRACGSKLFLWAYTPIYRIMKGFNGKRL